MTYPIYRRDAACRVARRLQGRRGKLRLYTNLTLC